MLTDLYFEIPNVEVFPLLHKSSETSIQANLVSEDYQIALVGIPESFNSIHNKGCSLAPDEIRKYLYPLTHTFGRLNIRDLGNLRKGKQTKDSYFAIESITEELLKENIFPVFLGGSQDFSLPVFQGIANYQRKVNLCIIDSKLDLGTDEGDFHSLSFLKKIIENSSLSRFDIIGTQTYFLSQQQIDCLKDIDFENLRLGIARNEMSKTEVYFRSSDFISLDMGVIRQGDAPGYAEPVPNGFFGEEMCQLARYAGISDRLKAFGLFEMNPSFDRKGQSAALAAQIIWYLLDGLNSRFFDYPRKNIDEYDKIVVEQTFSKDYEMVFYHNPLNGRFWLKIPRKNGKEEIIPCTQGDFLDAKKDFIPQTWSRYFLR